MSETWGPRARPERCNDEFRQAPAEPTPRLRGRQKFLTERGISPEFPSLLWFLAAVTFFLAWVFDPRCGRLW